MRYSPTLLNPPSTWLSSLKASQLQKIAQATGIRSAGPKAALINRLETELAQCEYPSPSLVSKNKTKTNPKNQNLSILSIDMGIRNLAFAHLLVPSPQSTTRGTASMTTPTLNAWRRLAVSDLLLPSGPEPSSPSPSLPELGSIKGTDSSDIDELSEFACQKDKDGKEMFHPSPYAKQAYILITTLLEKYQPTHVLIERQRFRSGGGSAVQEWTLRVGVFEEGKGEAGGNVFLWFCAGGARRGAATRGPVLGDRLGGEEVEKKKKEEEEEEGRRRRSSSSSSSSSNTREGKKVKMDLVGGWLDDALADGERGLKVAVSGDEELQGWVEAYLAKWKGKKRRRGAVGVADIGKLDDLADCLLQGVTWLDWHIMRDRLLREGVGALEN